MASDIFLDTSGLYAYIVKSDVMHTRARKIVQSCIRRGRKLYTTDYIVDETATLLKARGFAHVLHDLFEAVSVSKACHVEWMDAELFHKTKALLLKFGDHAWSFTDCFSFIVMRMLKLTDALTRDTHFNEAGFVVLLK